MVLEIDDPSHETDELFGSELLANLIHCEGSVSLAEACAIGGQEKWKVAISGSVVAESVEEERLLVAGREQVSPSDNLIDAHEGIVGHDGKLVGKIAVGASEYEVATICGEIGGLRTIMTIDERRYRIGELETPSRIAREAQFRFLRLGEIEARACVYGMAIGGVGGGSRCKVLATAEALVGQPSGVENVESAGVYVVAQALVVRTMTAFGGSSWTLIGLQSEP